MHAITQFKTHAQGLEGWISTHNELTVGHIFLQEEPNKKLKFLDAWVHPDYRGEGLFSQLWEISWKYVLDTYSDYTVYAWCKHTTLPLLIEKGFRAGDVCTYVERKVTADHSYNGPTVPITC